MADTNLSSTNTALPRAKRITLATIKAFIAKNRASLLISTRSRFDGMTDGVESCGDQTFRVAAAPNREGKPFVSRDRDNTLGIAGAWFVFDSRDYFRPFDEKDLVGYRVSNCCGDFVLAIRKTAQAVAA